MNQTPKIFSFFAGAGFLDLGFEMTGFEITYANEIQPSFRKAYQYSRQHLRLPFPEYGFSGESITKFAEGEGWLHLKELIKDARRTSDIIGFIGGPPCPDFSVGGKNKGCEGENGKLSAAYVEIINQQKPDFFLFENVKGLWRTKKHRCFFEKLKDEVREAGYVLTECLINAIEYGVPQNRERIILLGFHRSFLEGILEGIQVEVDENPLDYIFPWKSKILYPKDKVFNYSWSKTHEFQENSDLAFPEDVPKELTVEYWFRQNDVLNHPNAEHHFKPKAGLQKFMSIQEGDDSKKSFKRLHRWRYSPTACYGNNEVHLHPYKARRISVAESLAIQSLPRDFIISPDLSLTDMFKIVGNGVPYLAAKSLAQSIHDFFSQSNYLPINKFTKQMELSLVLDSWSSMQPISAKPTPV